VLRPAPVGRLRAGEASALRKTSGLSRVCVSPLPSALFVRVPTNRRLFQRPDKTERTWSALCLRA
jgi:hypothetical protein